VTDIAIQVKGLSKYYRIGKREGYLTLKDSLTRFCSSTFNLFTNKEKGESKEKNNYIWALKDISFEITKGEIIGIIGRNGAGKTTLLKILSKITEPTEGYAVINGRVGSLLEVGTGFHPELTGRENIYLNGAILGMKKVEIQRKFDEIVAFAEIEKFLDTPVKRYSSGMYVRLAFAVAAHLEPEILMVDEVLAVGDAVFQKKCLGKMGDAAREGRTVLFVSHNLGTISRLCERIFWLDGGRVAKVGSPHEVIHDYLYIPASVTGTWTNSFLYEIEPDIKLLSASIMTADGVPRAVVRFDETFNLEICYEVRTFSRSPWTLLFRVSDSTGAAIFTSWDIDSVNEEKSKEIGEYRAICHVPSKLLRPGTYSVSLGTYFTNTNMRMSNFHEHLFHFEVSSVGYTMNANRGGVITPVLKWAIQRSND